MPNLTDREMLVAVCEMFEGAVREADRPRGGMSVPYHGDFAAAIRQPGVMRDVRMWARDLRAHLTATEPRPAPPDRPLAPCMYCCCSPCGCDK